MSCIIKNKTMKIISIITTRDRVDLLPLAINSICNQSRLPDELIIVSDSSNDNFDKEKDICKKFKCSLIQNKYTSNYAGSLNTAIHKIINERLDKFDEIPNLYIAILDDDDTWHSSYLEKCAMTITNNEDFVVTGLNFYDDYGLNKKPIKSQLLIDDFLKGNPHIQGSNTFIKLETLLKCGLFDENMESAVDRDLFVRIMMLKPKYCILNEHLVNVNATSSHQRITNNYNKKLNGLKYFYYKYSGMMTEDIKRHFFKRIKNLFNIQESDILIKDKFSSTENRNNNDKSLISKNHKLLIGFIVTDYKLGIRLLKQIINLNRLNTRILIILNFNKSKIEYENILKNSIYPHTLITLNKIYEDSKQNKLFSITASTKKDNYIINDISTSRSILQHYLYEESNSDETIWIMDEDMELKELIIKDYEFSYQSINVDEIISLYKYDFDAVIGQYCLDAPLPLMSTLRTSLLDYVYNKFSNPSFHSVIYNNDYYYDLSDSSNLHLETPIKNIECKNDLDLIFSGKATSRPLFIYKNSISDAKSRGGNTFIFNKELLKLPNWSITIKNQIGRRSDYFWVLSAKNNGYKISTIPYGLTHNRSISTFDYKKEENKLLQDIIGSSFTKTIEATNINIDHKTFYEIYSSKFMDRLTKYACSYYRIIGILQILNEQTYRRQFSTQKLEIFINHAMSYICYNTIKQEFENFNKHLFIWGQKDYINNFKNELFRELNLQSLKFLGSGKEGVVYTDNINVYKCFFKKPDNWDLLSKIDFSKCEQLYSIKTLKIKDFYVISYKYNESIIYEDGHAQELTCLIKFAKDNGFIFTNIKKENFIVVNNKIKMIDYGSSVQPYTDDAYHRSVKRAYQMFRYSFLDNNDFRELISMSYSGDANAIDYGFKNFEKLIDKRSKEEIHDDLMFKLIDVKNKKILDYGAGRCNIANLLSKNNDVDVFDIDIKTIKENASINVNILTNIESASIDAYDLIICNLVLCCTTINVNKEIINNISNLLKLNGRLIISICNPFFNEIKNSEICSKIDFDNYHNSCIFNKRVNANNNVRVEFHRPIEYYSNLLNRNGFHIMNISESDGVNFDDLMPISEHLFFDCVLKRKNTKINDCSLLIKTNPMEYKNIYKQICHIVGTLENNISFNDRVVTVDVSSNIVRTRKYSDDNIKKLIDELNKAKENNLIDNIIFAENNSKVISETYKYWFNVGGYNQHSLNGQAIYATLKAFDLIKTPYVFQTDSDIIYSIGSTQEFISVLDIVRNGAISSTLSIPRESNGEFNECKRIEVRSSFLNLKKLKKLIPLENFIKNNKLQFSWHRSLDKKINDSNLLNVRLFSDKIFFIHPQNSIKENTNIISYARNSMEQCFFPKYQLNNLDLIPNPIEWIQQINANIVIYIRGYNTCNSKIKRLFDSLHMQNNKNFHILYLDDASDNGSGDYAKFILRNNKFFKDRSTFIQNEINMGTISNFVTCMNIIFNKNAIVINVDNDDCLASNNAIERIIKEFDNGADLTCGNCIRYDKPTKKYNIISFDKLWERNGDNVWLHPKCFSRKLFDYIDIENDLKIDGKYIDVNTDFALIVPMIRNAVKPTFIKDVIYYFEPSKNNVDRVDKYRNIYKQQVKNIILEKDKNSILSKNGYIYENQDER